MSGKYYKTCLKNAINFHLQCSTEINYFSSTWEVSQIIMTLKPGKKNRKCLLLLQAHKLYYQSFPKLYVKKLYITITGRKIN
jgi:hypothetical protein